MNQLSTFNFESRAVRVVSDADGEPLFVGKDVCVVLGYSNHNDAMNAHCKGVAKRYPLQTPGGIQEMRVLTEADVLRLVVNSKLPAAEQFERWVFEDVLPSVRKTGVYVSSSVLLDSTKPENCLRDLPDTLARAISVGVTSKAEARELFRAATLAAFHGADVIMAANRPRRNTVTAETSTPPVAVQLELAPPAAPRKPRAAPAPAPKPEPLPMLHLTHRYAIMNTDDLSRYTFDEVADAVDGGEKALRSAMLARGWINEFDAPTTKAAGLFVRKGSSIKWCVRKLLRACGAIIK